MNTTNTSRENQVWLDDRETGESFRVVKSQIEKDGSETLVVTSSALPLQVTALSVKVTSGILRYAKTKLFVLLMEKGMDILGDIHVTQYEKAVFVALARSMRYGNTVNATLAGIAEATGMKKPHISRALKALIARGAITPVDGDPLLRGIPTYEVNSEMVFRGSFSDAMRKREIDRYKEVKLAVANSR